MQAYKHATADTASTRKPGPANMLSAPKALPVTTGFLAPSRPISQSPVDTHVPEISLPEASRPEAREFEVHDGPTMTPAQALREAFSAQASGSLIQSEQDLVVQLCRMPIDLAAPLLRASLAALDTPALLALIAATGEAHHKLVACRADLDWRVIKALIKSNSDEVLLALAENTGLAFDDEDQATLARLSEDRVMLRAALLANPGLSRARAHIKLNAEDGLSHNNLKLVRLLRAGQINAFVLEAARRLKCESTHLQRVLAGDSATPLALTICALGLDRAVFLTLLPHWQAGHGGAPVCNAAHKPLILSVFTMGAEAAMQKLRAIAPGLLN